MEYLKEHGRSEKFNLGSGTGYSVKEIIEASRNVTGHEIPAVVEKRYVRIDVIFGTDFTVSLIRRPGDAATLIASSEKAEKMLGWKRKYTNVEDIVRSAWNFHREHPNGL